METFEVDQYIENTPPSLGARMLTRDFKWLFYKGARDLWVIAI